MGKQCKDKEKMNNILAALSPEELNTDNNIMSITNDLVDAIDAIEFYDEGYGEYNTIAIDQIYNLPSVIASRENINNMPCISDNINKLNLNQICQLTDISDGNIVNIIKNTLYASITSNLERYYCTNRLINSLGLNINSKAWKCHDSVSEVDRSNQIYLYRIIFNTLFEKDYSPTFSIFKDDDKGIDNTNAKIELSITQIYIYITSLISFFMNDDINMLYNKVKIKEGLDFIKDQYHDTYTTMKPMFNVLKEEDAGVLIVKQLLSLDLYNWFESVLKPLITNVISQSFKTNYFVYHDAFIDNRCKQLEDNDDEK